MCQDYFSCHSLLLTFLRKSEPLNLLIECALFPSILRGRANAYLHHREDFVQDIVRTAYDCFWIVSVGYTGFRSFLYVRKRLKLSFTDAN
jgi:hypothetical protein